MIQWNELKLSQVRFLYISLGFYKSMDAFFYRHFTMVLQSLMKQLYKHLPQILHHGHWWETRYIIIQVSVRGIQWDVCQGSLCYRQRSMNPHSLHGRTGSAGGWTVNLLQRGGGGGGRKRIWNMNLTDSGKRSQARLWYYPPLSLLWTQVQFPLRSWIWLQSLHVHVVLSSKLRHFNYFKLFFHDANLYHKNTMKSHFAMKIKCILWGYLSFLSDRPLWKCS